MRACECANGFGKSKARLVNGAAIEWQDSRDQSRPKLGNSGPKSQNTDSITAAIVRIVVDSVRVVVVVVGLILNLMKIPATWRMRNIIWQQAGKNPSLSSANKIKLEKK